MLINKGFAIFLSWIRIAVKIKRVNLLDLLGIISENWVSLMKRAICWIQVVKSTIRACFDDCIWFFRFILNKIAHNGTDISTWFVPYSVLSISPSSRSAPPCICRGVKSSQLASTGNVLSIVVDIIVFSLILSSTHIVLAHRLKSAHICRSP